MKQVAGLLLFSLSFLIGSNAADVSDLTWTVGNNQVTITGCSQGAAGILEIPGELGGNPVTAIGQGAFADCAGLTQVILPEGVKSIQSEAFDGCTGLTQISLPNSLNNIFQMAFRNCSSLTSMSIPAYVFYMDGNIFTGCHALTEINVTETCLLFSSMDGVVYDKYKTSLKLFPPGRGGAFVIPDSVTEVAAYAFYACSKLTGVTIPPSVDELDRFAFTNCTRLAEVTISEGVTEIDNYTFMGCSSLVNITLPESVTVLGSEAFSGCESLTSVVLPGNLDELSYGTFTGCTSLKSITIPETVTEIENEAFKECTSLAQIVFEGNAPNLGRDVFEASNPNLVVEYGETATGFEEDEDWDVVVLDPVPEGSPRLCVGQWSQVPYGWVYGDTPKWGTSSFMGPVWIPYYPYIYHINLGWLYHVCGADHEHWFYDIELGYLNASEANGGWFYYFEPGTQSAVWSQFSQPQP